MSAFLDPATGKPYLHMQQTASTIACCLCGTDTVYNKAALCPTCLKSQVDITEGIDRNPSVPFCRGCERFNRSPQWVECALESPELMSVCLRTIKGLDKVKLLDANWIWTEPHCRRLKIRLTVQKEALGVTIQQDVVVELIMKSVFCDDCHRGEAKNSATSTVQVRQHVTHKRTFLYLEQMILRHAAHKKISGFSPGKNGLDFEFARPQDAASFVDFVKSVVPTKCTSSKKLVGENRNSNETSYRFKHSVLIAPICKHDLIILPASLAKSCKNISRIVLCSKVSSNVAFIDPFTGEDTSISAAKYFKQKKLSPLFSAPQLTEYFVIDNTLVDMKTDPACLKNNKNNNSSNSNSNTDGNGNGGSGRRRNKKKGKKKNRGRSNSGNGSDSSGGGNSSQPSSPHLAPQPTPESFLLTSSTAQSTASFALGDIEVARSVDLGVNDDRFFVRSHLGRLLNAGDLVMGYDLANSNLSVDIDDLPDVVLVRKKRLPRKRGKQNSRNKKNKGKKNKGEVIGSRKTLGGVSLADNEEEVDEVMQGMEEDGLLVVNGTGKDGVAAGATLAKAMNAEGKPGARISEKFGFEGVAGDDF